MALVMMLVAVLLFASCCYTTKQINLAGHMDVLCPVSSAVLAS